MYTQRKRCEKCGKLIINPMGNPQAPYLLVGEYPGKMENIQGLPFAFRQKPTQTFAGDILQTELTRAGIMLNTVLVTNIWQHQKDEKECDPAWHVDEVAKLFADRTHVLLMGSEATEAFLGVKVNQVSGLKVDVPGFRKVRFWASPNPGLAYSQPIGELRLALRRFSEDMKKKTK
jgi:uracil-DNA glycosylase family 4